MLIKDPPVEPVDGLLMLGTNEYPLFLVKGRGEGLIFEGGTGAMGPLVLEQLDELGIERDFVKQLVITHAHPDHVMAVPALREAFPGLTVLASTAAAKTLGVEKAIGFFRKIDRALTGALLKAGKITDAHKPKPFEENNIAVDQIIRDGEMVGVGGDTAFRVIETPGHSECSLSFFEAGKKILIVSDATGYYMPEHNCWWPNYFTDYGAYVASIERLAECRAKVVCLSHNGVITGADDVKAYFDGALEATKAYHQRIVKEITAGKSMRQLAEELGTEVHEKTPLLPVDFFQKNCGQLVKQSVKHEGIQAQP